MAPNTPKTPNSKPTADKAGTNAAPEGATVKLKDLVDQVSAATGAKKADVRRTVEATLTALGAALAAKSTLVVPPLGKLRVAKAADGVLTLKLRQTEAQRGAGLALAEDEEDS